MNFKTTYTLFGVLVAAYVLFALNQLFSSKPGEELYLMGDLRRANITSKDIQAIEIERSRPTAEKLVFARDPQTKHWKLEKPYAARVESDEAVNRIFSEALDARRVETADRPHNVKEAGLDPPATVVTFTAEDGRRWKMNLGDQTIGGKDKALVYANSPADPRDIMPIRRGDLEELFQTAKDFRSKDLLAGNAINLANAFQEVDLKNATGELKLAKKSEVEWLLKVPNYGDADYDGNTANPHAATITGVRDLLNDLEKIKVAYASDGKLDDFVAEDVSDWAKYGLENGKPATLRVEVLRKGAGDDKEERAVLLVGKKADDKGDKYFARLDGENNVVRVSAKPIDELLAVVKDPNVLRSRDLAKIDEKKVDAIDIQNGQGTIKLRETGTPPRWKLYDTPDKGQNADQQSVKALLRGLLQKRQVSAFPEKDKTDKELGLDTPSGEVSLWVDGLKKDEKDKEKAALKDDKKPTVKLIFGAKPKDDKLPVYVKREVGGEVTRLAVPASVVDRITESRLAYLDKTLPSFKTEADISRVVIARDGGKDTVELVREKTGDDKGQPVWRIKQPKELEGRGADLNKVKRLTDDLAFLLPEKLIAEKADAKQLKEWKLDPPRFQVTVTVRLDPKDEKKTEEWVYQFGDEVKDKGVYGKMNKSGLVYLVQPEWLKTLQENFADPHVFRFVPAKVKTMRLSGWKAVERRTMTLDMERKDKTWIVKNDLGDFQLDPFKVDQLVHDLADLRAEKFIAFKTGAKPEYALDKETRTLEIEISLDGEKTPLLLTIGKLLEKEKGYAAQSSGLPGDVFVLPQDRFKALVEGGLKYFSK